MLNFRTVHTIYWEATFAPEHGGHLVRLRHKSFGCDILNFPHTDADYYSQSERYGIPILFPPNRLAGGTFKWEGKNYSLPLNEPTRQNHLHGIVREAPWEIDVFCAEDHKTASVCLRFCHGPHRATFEGYPHCFNLKVTYDFLQDEVTQSIQLENLDEVSCSSMPFGLGFHTAFRLPENPDSQTRIQITALDQCYELDAVRRLPSGNIIPWPSQHKYYLSQGSLYTGKSAISCHFPAVTFPVGEGSFRGAVLDFEDEGICLTYEVSEDFGYWFLWTPPDDDRVICIEPMTCMANAANSPIPEAISGWLALPSGQSWQANTRLHLQRR